MLKKLFQNKTLVFVIGLVLVSLILHLAYLSWPDWQVFDEIYYYNWGGDYLKNIYFFDVHPPLGKLIISLGLLIFNNSLFGARFFQAIVGASLIYFIYFLAKILFKNKIAAFLCAVLLLLETSIFVESRFALINIFILFFVVLSYISFWNYRQKQNVKYFYFSLFFASLAASVKWTGAGCILVFLLFTILDQKARILFISNFKKRGGYITKFLLISILSLILPYILIFIIDIVKGERFYQWHKQAYQFHKNLKSSHPYASRWYKWFLDVRPIWFEFRQTPTGDVIGVNQIGNPIILWLGTISILFNIVWTIIKKNKALLLVILTILVNTIPWMFIGRESFYYHFIPIIPFLILSLGYFLYLVYTTWNLGFLVLISIVLALAFFIWYWPLLNGIKISYEAYNNRVIFSSWR